MAEAIQMAGKSIGRLTVLKRVENDRHGKARFLCRCECGNETVVVGRNIRIGNSLSCGCLHDEQRRRSKTHGQAHRKKFSPEYISFKSAKQRCTNKRNKDYKNYGARGVQFRFESFEQFFAEVGKRPSSEHSIDRKNNEGHYERGNVRWATPTEQRKNQRRYKHS